VSISLVYFEKRFYNAKTFGRGERMMKSKWGYIVSLVLITAIFSACTASGPQPADFQAQPIPGGNWNQKVDSLYFILDASFSMDADGKLATARGVIDHFNQTMPPLNIMVALRSFGHSETVSSKISDLMAEPRPYTRSLLPDGLAKISEAGGFSHLEQALKDAAADLENMNNRIAVIIVSDGKDMGDAPLAAAKALGEAHAGRLCIYTVLAGDDDDGRKLLAQIAQATGCGRAVTADSLASGAAMNAFVKEVLISGKADSDGDGVTDDMDRCPNTPRGVTVDRSGCPLDSDKDGVPDYKDQCPDTPKGVRVDARGCPPPKPTLGKVTATGTYVFKDIQFESNRASLKSSSYPTLNNIAEALKAQPDMKVEIQGHTDGRGKHDYNVGLSQRRAETVKAYLVTRGVDSERMVPRGYGPDRPIAPNSSAQGRAMNRRVEFKPIR
jgi:OmpA-OmpF porin, OOP family